MEWDHLVGQQLGQYELLAELGQGTYAYVYQAFQPRLRRYVAIKALHITDQAQQAFLQEFEQVAQTIAQLNHPNIVSIYDFGEEQGLPYIVMQSVTGGSFKQRLGKPMAVGEAVTPVIQLARALHHAHQRGVLHLDVRPENILIDQENPSHPLLTDFSLSQLFLPEFQARTGLPIGTPAYLAPEQIEGQQPTARTDVYALGALLFEALAGRPAFSGPSAATTLSKQLHEPPPYIRGFNPAVPRELARVVSRALAKQPGERYESAEAFARALEPHRDTKERQHRLHLTLEDLAIADDDDPEEGAQAPQGAPSRAGGQARPGNLQHGSGQSHEMAKARLQPGLIGGTAMEVREAGFLHSSRDTRPLEELPALPASGLVITERPSLVNAIGASVFRLARRMAGKTHLGQRLDGVIQTPRAQGIAGIGALCLALLLSLSITLLAVSAPALGSERHAPLSLSASQPTPTDTPALTPTPGATPSPTPTPGGPVVDPRAAAAIANLSAALSTDTRCHLNPDGATLPAGRTFYVTICFNARAIPGGGTASLSILPRGTASSSANESARVGGSSSYHWFQFSHLASGTYTIEVFWNGKLGRIYSLTLG